MEIRKLFRNITFIGVLTLPSITFASFIEASIGTAVINDATASYYNPAALTLLKAPQIIGLGSVATFQSEFTGQSTQALTGFTQSGSTNTNTTYYLPSVYFALPANDRYTVGLAILSNYFNNNLDENSILRYAQSSNKTKNLDVVPAIGIKLNKFISVGAGINFSYANFITKPTIGFPSLNIPDSETNNNASANSVGGDVGLLLKLTPSTLIGFNYRTAITYHFSGTSTFESTPDFTSNHYTYDFWLPAKVLTISQFFTPSLGFITTIQYIQWNIFKEINAQGIAARIGNQNRIVNADIPFHLNNTWLVTLGGQYRVNPKWIVRIASTYIQSPGNNNYQLANGDSIVLGGSTGYEIFKNIILDASYAHAFIHDENIHIATARNDISGVNSGERDGVALKITFNI